jgi:hypothetical protein
MAILGPADLPVVLQVPSDPIKKYVLTKLGYPVTEVELTEDQLEVILRTAGDFIAHYVPKSQRLAYFYTTPFQAEYPLPNDAYWVQEVAWDPVTTNISDIFSAEMFLFCFPDSVQALRDDGELIALQDWQDSYRAKTPFGSRRLKLERHEHLQPIVEVVHEHGSIRCTPNHPLKTASLDDMIDGWEIAQDCLGKTLVTPQGPSQVLELKETEKSSTVTVYALGAHCFWASLSGVPVLVH